MLTVGDAAPDVALVFADGTSRPLSDWAGRKLALYFYPRDDTPGCTTEAQDFTRLLPEFAAADTDVVGVSRDTAASHDKFAAKYALDHRLAVDDGAVSEAFGTWVEKSMYGRKYMGLARATFLLGRDGRVAAAWPKVSVKGHADAVLKAAQALG